MIKLGFYANGCNQNFASLKTSDDYDYIETHLLLGRLYAGTQFYFLPIWRWDFSAFDFSVYKSRYGYKTTINLFTFWIRFDIAISPKLNTHA